MSLAQDVLRKYVNLDYQRLVSMAKLSLYNIYPVCREADGEEPACSTIASVVLSAIYADGKVALAEEKFLRDVLGIDEKDTELLINYYTFDMPDKIKKFSKNLSDEIKIEIAKLILCIGSADESLAKEEALFMLDIIGR